MQSNREWGRENQNSKTASTRRQWTGQGLGGKFAADQESDGKYLRQAIKSSDGVIGRVEQAQAGRQGGWRAGAGEREKKGQNQKRT